MSSLSATLKTVAAAAMLCIGAQTVSAATVIPAGHERVLVTAKAGSLMAVKQAVAALHGKDVRQLKGFDIMGVTLPTAAVAKLRAIPGVRAVESNAPRFLMTQRPSSVGFKVSDGSIFQAGQKVPFGIGQSQADQVSDQFAANRKVCIIDSGYDLAHPDLQKTGVTGWTNGEAAYTEWSRDENSHGTHVAGTISALDNETGVVGVMSGGNINLHIAKVFDGSGSTGAETILQAVLECRDKGANVLSMSLGGPLNLVAEEIIYEAINRSGILVIAAAGNDGNTRISYPAGYAAVVSVGALNEAGKRASFSQFNADVELSAAGENVLSTVPFDAGRESVTTVSGAPVESNGMEGSPVAQAAADLFDLGKGRAADGNKPGAAGKICLIERGEVAFSEKVLTCQNSGGKGAIIFNNAAGNFGGTMGGVATTIPSVSISREDGLAIQARVAGGAVIPATVALNKANYAFFNGTSMATPHVSAVAALVWSYAPQCTNEDVRRVLGVTAKDLGAPGRDPSYGHGLVQAKAARDLLVKNCGR